MAQGVKTPPEKVAEVKALLEEGYSQNQAANTLEVSKGIVNRIAKGELVPATNILDLIKNNHEDFLTAILSRMGERLEKELGTGTPTGIRSLALSYAIMYDKRALTRGEPTQIAEGIERMGDAELLVKAKELTDQAEGVRKLPADSTNSTPEVDEQPPPPRTGRGRWLL